MAAMVSEGGANMYANYILKAVWNTTRHITFLILVQGCFQDLPNGAKFPDGVGRGTREATRSPDKGQELSKG